MANPRRRGLDVRRDRHEKVVERRARGERRQGGHDLRGLTAAAPGIPAPRRAWVGSFVGRRGKADEMTS
ncbi:hypothetical protein QJS66_12970 [Kocuria rhizophila]|nr:hypothetical protein QJS66_12970 [Kocuria rhizophila]